MAFSIYEVIWVAFLLHKLVCLHRVRKFLTGCKQTNHYTQQTSHTNDLVNAKNHEREKPLLAV